MTKQKLYTVLQVARELGVARTTVERWLYLNKIPEPRRDRNGWRRFTEKDLAKARAFANSTRPPRMQKRKHVKQLQP